MPKQESPVWLMTGCSTGLGRALAGLVIDRGWRAVVTARDKARVEYLVRGAFGFDAVTKRMEQRLDEVRSQRELTLSADFSAG